VRILLTNDDGVRAPGLHRLAAGLAATDHDLLVVAPEHEMSGSSSSTGPLFSGSELAVRRHREPALDGIEAHAIDGPPALCVMAARLGAFGDPPDLVVSGINPGMNTGRGALHSGTVGAALTGQAFGISALAVSIDGEDDARFDTAAAVARAALGWLVDAPRRSVLNVNVPNVEPHELAGVRWARLAATSGVRASLAESAPGRLRLELTPTDLVLKPDTDTARVHAGYVAVTLLNGVTAADESPVAEAIELAL